MDIDRDTEQRVSDWLQPGREAVPDHVLRDVIENLPTTPQTRRRNLGRWFERVRGVRRGTDEHDQPPPDTRRTRLMFSATGLVAALAILALAVNVVGPTTSPPHAGSGQQLIVAADGSGDYTSINDAVTAATDGDTVLVRPGTYDEFVTIDKDVDLVGDGPREDIVIHPTSTEPSTQAPLRAILLLSHSDATVSGLTFSGEDSLVMVLGGAPTLTDLWFRGVGTPFLGPGAGGGQSLSLKDTRAQVLDNLFTDGGEITVDIGAAPLIEGNELRGGPHIYLGSAGDETIVRGNTVIDSLSNGIGITGRGSPLIEGNVFDGSGNWGVFIGYGASTGVDPILRDNVITRAPVGINLDTGSAPTLEGNTIDVEGTAIHLSGPADPVLAGNTICGGEAIITTQIPNMSGPSLEGNEVCELVASD